MELTELKYKISRATGIPFDELPGLTNQDAITSARAIVGMRKEDADQRKKSVSEQFADWFSGETQQSTTDEAAYSNAIAALDELERQACTDVRPRYPDVPHGGLQVFDGN